MPSANHETTLARLWELLKILPSRPPGKTAREICEKLEAAGHAVSKRTIERNLGELSRIFPILSNEISKPYGWYWKPGSVMNLPGIDLAEAVSLGLLEELLRQLVPPTFIEALDGRFSEAREKLQALPQNPYAKWSDLVRYVPPGMPFIPPAVAPGVLPSIQEALLHQRQLQVDYLNAGATTAKEQTLHPLSLIQQGARCYLVASAFDYDTPLLYAVHRMATVTVLAEPARRPKGYSLDGFIASGAAQFGSGYSVTLKARVSADLARLLEETPLARDQQITTRAGIHTLTVTVQDSWQLHFWILSQGSAITVVKPAALCKQIIASLESSLANYKKP